MSEAPKAVHTMDDIAALMASNRAKMQEDGHYPSLAAEEVPNEVAEQAEEDEQVETQEEEHEAPTEATSEETADTETTPDEAPDQEPVQVETEAEEFLVGEDDLIEIEGHDEPVSFKQLKDVYTADKDTVARVEQTVQALDEATTTRRQADADAVKVQQAMNALVQGIDQALAAPMVQQPDAALKVANPAQYIAQMEAYNQDVARIQETRGAINQALAAHAEEAERNHKALQQQEFGVLTRKIPALSSQDQETKKAASKDILDAASHYGFSEAEVNIAADHRLFLMAYDAAQYRKLQAESTETKEERTQKVQRRIASQPKVLRSRGATQRPSSAAKKVKVVKSRATKTGNPKDVAAYMAAKRAADH